MKKLVIGILAHVDAGKTTLSESMLYLSGKIRTLGRVDKKDAYLDTNVLERERGITIFSKQAIMEIENTQITLLDTPGHMDFSAEMERTLQVLDYAILVISGADGVQGHTLTLWNLLKIYKIPVFLFVNKMDQIGTDKDKLIAELKSELSDGCIDFTLDNTNEFYEQLAMCDEDLLDDFLDKGLLERDKIIKAIRSRKVFPCLFGAALKLEGIEELLNALITYTTHIRYTDEFGSKIFKITRDEQGNRLTHMKITGGKLTIKDVLQGKGWQDKVNQIRLYSGDKFEAVTSVGGGTICAVTGLNHTKPGEGLGNERASNNPLLEPVLSYKVSLPEGYDPRVMLPMLKEIEEEQPELQIVWDENLQELQAKMMGEIQTEILQGLILERFNIKVNFGLGNVVYKETIKNTVEGVGHFEPLGHYAEVHLLLEPGERGSGIKLESICSEEMLDKSTQRLVLSHLVEKDQIGVLTGSVITDMKITLVSGGAHKKHTSGGDFREATYRALRQGLKQAQSILLEPYYSFRLEIPEDMVGRAMTDIERMNGKCEISKTSGDTALLVGKAPVVAMGNYQQEVTSYTKGYGRLFYSPKGYEQCHNANEVIERIDYDSEKDPNNPTGSIFCKQGAGFSVPWNQVHDYMHIESYLKQKKEISGTGKVEDQSVNEQYLGLEEIEELISKTFSANQGKKSIWKKQKSARDSYYRLAPLENRENKKIEHYLLVDGYNIIFDWTGLKEIAKDNLEGARIQLLEVLSNYQGIKGGQIIVVFDAYKVQGQREETSKYYNIYVVYTKEAQTADQYIERFVNDHHTKYSITVATSDALEQVIIRGKGAGLLSAREFGEEVQRASKQIMELYHERQTKKGNYLMDELSSEVKDKMEDLLK